MREDLLNSILSDPARRPRVRISNSSSYRAGCRYWQVASMTGRLTPSASRAL